MSIELPEILQKLENRLAKKDFRLTVGRGEEGYDVTVPSLTVRKLYDYLQQDGTVFLDRETLGHFLAVIRNMKPEECDLAVERLMAKYSRLPDNETISWITQSPATRGNKNNWSFDGKRENNIGSQIFLMTNALYVLYSDSLKKKFRMNFDAVPLFETRVENIIAKSLFSIRNECLNSDESVAAYIIKAMDRAALDTIKLKEVRVRQHTFSDNDGKVIDPDAFLDNQPDSSAKTTDDLTERAWASMTAAAIREMVSKLKPDSDDRKFLDVYIGAIDRTEEKPSYAELAKMTGKTLKSVKSKVHRMREKFRSDVEDTKDEAPNIQSKEPCRER